MISSHIFKVWENTKHTRTQSSLAKQPLKAQSNYEGHWDSKEQVEKIHFGYRKSWITVTYFVPQLQKFPQALKFFILAVSSCAIKNFYTHTYTH